MALSPTHRFGDTGRVALGFLFGFAVLAVCLGSTPPAAAAAGPGRAADSEPTFVGRDRCIECHQTEHVRWTGSHHDLAMQVVNESTVLGDFDDVTYEHFGQLTTFYRDGDRFMVRTPGPEGEPEEFELAYTFGATPLQQYLIAFPGGRYQPLNIAWDSRPEDQGGQRWFHLFPEEAIPFDDELHWTGRVQNWNFTCAECHSTDLRRGYQPETNSYETTWAEIDVSCEACHGPASEHVVWADSQMPAVDDNLGLVVKLGDTSGGEWLYREGENTMHRTAPRDDQQLEMCAQCHSRRQGLLAEHEFGQAFLDTHRLNLLEERLYEADGQIKDEVFVFGSFLQSKMHAAGVACSDCHDSHDGDVLVNGNALCAQCHNSEVFDTPEHHHHEPRSAGAQCIACHMPARNYMVVDPRRDHSLRIPRPDLTESIGSPNACNGCHADQTPAWAAAAVEQWGGEPQPHYGEVLHAGRAALPGSIDLLASLATDREAPGIVRATALSLLERQPSEASLTAMEACLRDDDALVRAAALDGLAMIDPRGRPALAARLLSDPVRTVRITAARVLAASPRQGFSPADREAFGAAVAELVDSELASGGQPHAHHNIGLVLADMGQGDAAIEAYRRALELDPTFVRASVNLADVYRALEMDEQGETVLRAALEAQGTTSPASGDVHYALGMLLIRGKRMTDALTHLELAARLRTDIPRYAVGQALALQAAGDPVAGYSVLREAVLLHPRDTELLYTYATLARDVGELDQALEAALTLVDMHPDDPGLREFLVQLEAARRR